MDSPVLTVVSSMRSLAPFESPDPAIMKPKPRTLLFSPNDQNQPELSLNFSSVESVHCESESVPESPSACASPTHWFQRSTQLYDKKCCADSPWRRPSNQALPTLPQTNNADAVARVSCETVSDLIRGQYKHLFDEYVIMDCRFDYEYMGGHIEGSICVNQRDRVRHHFQKLRQRVLDSKHRIAIVFHCEYSQHRGPKTYRFFRSLDRQCNVYPHLSFPDVYVMNGGYRDFFASFVQHCRPMRYVPMDHASSKQWTNEIAKSRRSWKEADTAMTTNRSRTRSRSRLGSIKDFEKPKPPAPSFSIA